MDCFISYMNKKEQNKQRNNIEYVNNDIFEIKLVLD